MRRWLALGAALLAVSAPAAAAKAPEIAFTMDDLPVHSTLPPGTTRIEVAQRILDAFKAAHMPPVYGFINGVWTEKEPAATPVLAMWRAAGNLLGNHTWAHLNFDDTPLDAYVAGIDANVPLLEHSMAGQDWHWFRFPFLAEGKDPAKRLTLRAALAQRGYHIAQVTMSFGDYAWNEPYARCMAMHDDAAVAWLEKSYLAAAAAEATAARQRAQAIYGHDIPYVLLMHIGAFDARMLPRLLAQYRAEGFAFTTLPKAESDPAYAADVDPALPPAPSQGALFAKTGKPWPATHDYMGELGHICRPAATAAPTP